MEKVTLSKCQEEALNAFIAFISSDNPWMVISGFAGSGKTFLIKHMAAIAQNVLKMHAILDREYKAPTIQYTATTNKAAAVLESMLQTNVRTIHNLLGLRVVNNYETGQVNLEKHEKATRTPNSIVFIDEASMISRELLSFIKEYQENTPRCKLVFIGDPYQLPPVKEAPCNIFNAKEGHYFLDEIQRQVADSPIIKLSAKYREVLDDPDLPWPRIETDNTNLFFYDDPIKFEQQIANTMGIPHDPRQYKVLAWSNSIVRKYNKWIRNMHGYTHPFELNEIVMTNKPVMFGNQVIASTDTLHRIYDVEPVLICGINGFNIRLGPIDDDGDTFKVFQPANWIDANQLKKTFAKDEDWEQYFMIKQDWADLRPIHALTCHKAQGSTYKEVFVDLHDIGKNTRWQETARLAYVAVTRASHRLHIYGTITCNHQSKKRNKHLEAFKNVEHLL